MEEFSVIPIGKVQTGAGRRMSIELEAQYIPALKELDGFSHVNVLCWYNGCDFEEARNLLEVPAPYKKAPDSMGIFATRAPARPNPIGLTAVQILAIDHDKGVIDIAYIDANNGTPVIDLKPYTPSLDRIEAPVVPEWCRHWPKSLEESADFDWENEFNF